MQNNASPYKISPKKIIHLSFLCDDSLFNAFLEIAGDADAWMLSKKGACEAGRTPTEAVELVWVSWFKVLQFENNKQTIAANAQVLNFMGFYFLDDGQFWNRDEDSRWCG